MKEYCVASMYDNPYWYECSYIDNLSYMLEDLDYSYHKDAENRLYVFGNSSLDNYPDITVFDKKANNIAVVIDYPNFNTLEKLKDFKKIVVTSESHRKYLWSIPDVLPMFSLLKPEKKKYKKVIDIGFIGDLRRMDILDTVVPIVEKHSLNLKIFGSFFDYYCGNYRTKSYWTGHGMPVDTMSKLVASTKIFIHGHNKHMNEVGITNQLYIDYIKCKGFVISDDNQEVKEVYKGVTVASSKELEKSLLFYLEKDEERTNIVSKQYRILSKNNSYESSLTKLKEVLTRK